MTANELANMRKQGRVPELLVLSFIGRLQRVPLPILLVTRQTDPRLFVGMNVVLAHAGNNINRVIEFAGELVRVGVDECCAWDVFNDSWVSIVSLGSKYIARVPSIFYQENSA